MLIQSVRNVGSVAGYPYFAYGVYRPVRRQRDGKATYRLVKSGQWFRSDVDGRTAFDGIAGRTCVRQCTPVNAGTHPDA